MGGLVASTFSVVFPRRSGRRKVSPTYLVLLVLMPAAVSTTFGLIQSKVSVAIEAPGVLAESFGVLGGLLFAHAIFVFQLRLDYARAQTERDTSGADAPQESLRVAPMIDEMSPGVLYASVVALALTLSSALLASTMADGDTVPMPASVILVLVASHLAGCVVHVIRITTVAYSQLRVELS